MSFPIHFPHFPFEKVTAPGLYLVFDDGLFLSFTQDYIATMKDRYLADADLLPPTVRQAPAYRLCSVCPKRDTALICHAIPTVFPFIEHMDRFLSHDSVVAIYRPEPSDTDPNSPVVQVARTSVQRALQHVSVLSLIHYCEIGLAYFKYFNGVVPLLDPLLIAEQIYRNVFWELRGDQQAIDATLSKMRREMDVTIRCQIERLRLFCKSDAFPNAFVITHIVTQLLDTNLDALVRSRSAARSARHSEAVAALLH